MQDQSQYEISTVSRHAYTVLYCAEETVTICISLSVSYLSSSHDSIINLFSWLNDNGVLSKATFSYSVSDTDNLNGLTIR